MGQVYIEHKKKDHCHYESLAFVSPRAHPAVGVGSTELGGLSDGGGSPKNN